MMLRSLVDEVVRRRLWPIPLVAILVAIAAPVLFMKSAPDNAPAASETPAAAAPGALPASGERLLTASDKAAAPHKRVHRKGQDPFAPPASAVVKDTAAKTATTSSSSSSSSDKKATANAGAATQKSVPVVIKSSDGSTTTGTITTGAAKTATPKVTPAAAAPQTVTYVDVRFGPQMDTMLRYRVPRLQTFRAGGKVAAMFIRYSPKLGKAVFAIAPSTKVSGDAKCRKVAGVCRYVDIKSGSYARLKLRGANGAVVSRRLDVVQVRHLPAAENPTASARTTPLTAAKCLLKNLLALPAALPSIAADACE
jgi:hypothetical protein